MNLMISNNSSILCPGTHCKLANECKLHIAREIVQQVIDYSTYGSATSTDKETTITFSCGDNGNYKKFEGGIAK